MGFTLLALKNSFANRPGPSAFRTTSGIPSRWWNLWDSPATFFFTTFRKGGEMSLREQKNQAKQKQSSCLNLISKYVKKWGENFFEENDNRLTPKPTAGPTRQIWTSDGERRASTVRQCRCLPDHSFKQAAARVKQHFIFLQWRYWMANTNNSRRAAATAATTAAVAEHRSQWPGSCCRPYMSTPVLWRRLKQSRCRAAVRISEGGKKKSCFQGWMWMGSERRWTETKT